MSRSHILRSPWSLAAGRPTRRRGVPRLLSRILRLAPALALLGVVAMVAGGATPSAQQRPDPPPFTPATTLSLVFDPALAPADRAAVVAAISGTRPEARAILTAISGEVYVTASTTGGCPSTHTSCVRRGDPNDPADHGRPIVIQYAPEHLAIASTPEGRFVLLHEFGHAVDAAMLTAPGREAFRAALWGGADRARACRGSQGDCAAIHEQFADEFARWAGSFAVSLSAYKTPALIPSDTFTALLVANSRPHAPSAMFASWPH